MNREEFLAELTLRLRRLPQDEQDAAIAYYGEYLDDAGQQNEGQAIAQLGSPADVASKIIGQFAIRSIEPYKEPAKEEPQRQNTETAAPPPPPPQPQPQPKKTGGLKVLGIVLLSIFASPIALPIAITLFAVILVLIIVLFAVVVSFGATAIALIASGIATVIVSFGVILAQPATTLFFAGFGLLIAGLGGLLGVIAFLIGKACVKGIIKLIAKLMKRDRRAAA